MERKSTRSISGEHEARGLDWFRPSEESNNSTFSMTLLMLILCIFFAILFAMLFSFLSMEIYHIYL
jgi:hypothetical protein